ncbi:hypothetical protein AB0F68_31315 [Micromonospora sp. NPDC023966]|uniref:hypothetical protein n=1 Tax=Micromonospora sp. NPDC023966 TaxID=3154699 RepID=UPI0033C68EA2
MATGSAGVHTGFVVLAAFAFTGLVASSPPVGARRDRAAVTGGTVHCTERRPGAVGRLLLRAQKAELRQRRRSHPNPGAMPWAAGGQHDRDETAGRLSVEQHHAATPTSNARHAPSNSPPMPDGLSSLAMIVGPLPRKATQGSPLTMTSAGRAPCSSSSSGGRVRA